MTKEEFILEYVANNSSATPEEVLAAVLSETTLVYRKIGANEARQFFSVRGALLPLQNAINDLTEIETIPATMTPEGEGPVTSTVGELVHAVVGTLPDNSNRFATDPNTPDGLANRMASALLVAHGVLQQRTVDAFYRSAEALVSTYEGTTLDEVKSVISPPTKQLVVTPGDLGWTVSTNTKDRITFMLDAAASFSSFELEFEWRETGDAPWRKSLTRIEVPEGEAGLSSFTINRPQGIPAARHFRFFYTPAYEGQFNEITAELG